MTNKKFPILLKGYKLSIASYIWAINNIKLTTESFLKAYSMNKNKTWQIISEKSVFNSRIFEIFNLDCFLPSKNFKHNFYSIHLHDWINVFSITNDNKVILVKQHRLGKNLITLEAPAGAINRGEKPEDAAKRELLEETGYTSEKLILLKKISVNPAIQNNTCYFFLALNCKKNNNTKFDPAEEIEIVLKEKEELFDSLYSGEIDNSLAFLSIILARDYFKK